MTQGDKKPRQLRVLLPGSAWHHVRLCHHGHAMASTVCWSGNQAPSVTLPGPHRPQRVKGNRQEGIICAAPLLSRTRIDKIPEAKEQKWLPLGRRGWTDIFQVSSPAILTSPIPVSSLAVNDLIGALSPWSLCLHPSHSDHLVNGSLVHEMPLFQDSMSMA